MFAGQLECRKIVIIGGWRPAIGGVTGSTITFTKLSVMGIILLMAGKTIGWCAMVDLVYMAGRTVNTDMLTG
jgi:hypothetical protein